MLKDTSNNQPPTDSQNGIKITVLSNFLPSQSDPANQRFAFAYQITISNQSDKTAQLINRHWIITDGNEQVREVKGEGVVGEKPVIDPGEEFEYTSGAILETPVGSMQGSYDMVDADGQVFKAKIPMFTLYLPNVLN